MALDCTVPGTRVPFSETRRPERIDGSSGSFRNSTIGVVAGTPFAPLPGRCPTTDGREVSNPEAVVNALLKSATALLETSWMSLVATMVTTLAAGRVPPDRNTVRLSEEMPET